MAKYTVFESVNMGSTHYAERIFDAVAETDIENGTFGYLDGLADGETNVYKFKVGVKKGEPVVVVDNPAWTEDTCKITNQRRDKYINEAGKKLRVRVVKNLDEFGITIEGVTGASQEQMKKDAFVSIDPSTGKLVAAQEAADVDGMIGVVMRERVSGAQLVTTAHTYGYSAKIFEVKVTDAAHVKVGE